MKTNTNMKSQRMAPPHSLLPIPYLSLFTLILPLALAFLSLSCEQPFKAGLGAVIDVRPPTVELTSPGAGSSIYGWTRLSGYVEDDYKIDRVDIMVTNYPGEPYMKNWVATTLEKEGPNRGTWYFNIDTNKFEDGTLKIRVRAYDAVRSLQPVETADYVFQVRNNLPKIKLTSPLIIEDATGTPGSIGSNANSKLNFNAIKEAPSPISYPRDMQPRPGIQGIIIHEEDIYLGEANGKNFPPQIRLWRVDTSDTPDAPLGQYKSDELPSEAQVPWEDLVLGLTLFQTGIGRYQFIKSVPAEAGFYGFEIRAQSADGRVQFRYPRDHWPTIGEWDNPKPDTGAGLEFIYENRYVLIYVLTMEEPPRVKYWNLEDVLGQNTWNSGTNSYSNIANVDDDKAHEYVNKTRVYKNGKFTVRANARHSRGIKSALAFWESSENGKGVFIWNPAHETPPGPPTGWDSTATGHNVPANKPFNAWGYGDPNGASITNAINKYVERNFIFTYDPANFTLAANLDNPMKGKSQVWKYTGTKNWDTLNGPLSTELLGGAALEGITEEGAAVWQEVTTPLKEDTYTVIVYVISETDASVPSDKRDIRLDFVAPEVSVNAVNYEYSQVASPVPSSIIDITARVVNGVIRPRVNFSDSRIPDTGERIATASDSGAYFQNPATGAYSAERRYVLVDAASQTAMEAHRANKDWPGYTGAIFSDVTAARHGPIFGDNFRIKATEVYQTGLPTTTLTDDATYYLYVLSRDNAFNVGYSAPQKITVKASTDKPEIRITTSSIQNVINPNASADGTDEGFRFGGGYRNKFSASQAISLQLRDDDSLDLGSSTDDSSVSVKINGVKLNTIGNVTNNETAIEIPRASDDGIKRIFTPANVTAEGRARVPQIDGVITQSTLVELLKADISYDYLFADKGKSVTSLPDGIYKLTIDVKDYAPAKLELLEEVDPANVVEVKSADQKTIWFVVDSTPPALTYTETVVGASGASTGTGDQGWITLGAIPAGDTSIATGITIKGSVSDRHGPLTVTGFSITDSSNDISGATAVRPNEVVFTSSTDSNNKWTATFTAPVHIRNNVVSNVMTVTLTVTDRFGNSSTIVQRYRYDEVSPTVTIREPITRFDRDDATRVNISPPTPITAADARQRLANGVVSFVLNQPWDNQKVTEVRWWLLPSGTVLPTTSPNPTSTNAWDYAGVNSGRKGTLSIANGDTFTQRVFIDTFDPDDTGPLSALTDNAVYRLYVMATDEAGNLSASGAGAELDWVFIRQQEDAPYFLANTLSGVATSASMIVNMTINDDDGFYIPSGAGVGTGVRADTIRIWVTDATANTSAGPSDAGSYPFGAITTIANYIGPITVPPSAGGVTRISSTNKNNIRLNFNLTGLVDLIPNNTDKTSYTTMLERDTRKHYIIEATDSWYDKYIKDNGTKADATTGPSHLKTWRQYYTFEKDDNAPTVTITSPVTTNPAQIYKLPFTVTATLSDAHLKRDNGDYLLGVRLGSNVYHNANPPVGSTETSFKVTAASGAGTTSVGISVGIDNLLTVKGGWNGLDDGSYNLFISTVDESGQVGWSDAYSFVKDTAGPTFTFTRGFNDSKTPMPKIYNGVSDTTGADWWTKMGTVAAISGLTADERASYRTQRETLPLITHDNSEAPTISGTFKDALSKIKKTNFRIGWDGVVPSASTGVLIPDTDVYLEGDDTSVEWTVYLTENGTNALSATNKILSDGVHSIQLYIEDALGNVLADTDKYGFRIVSSTPKATITGPAGDIFSDRAAANPRTTTFLSVSGTGVSPNLSDVRVSIRYADSNSSTPYERSVVVSPVDAFVSANTWAHAGTGTIPQLLVTDTLAWTLNIPRSYIIAAGGVATETAAGSTHVILKGAYEITVTAIDKANKRSEPVSGAGGNQYTFTVDSDDPAFTFNLQNAAGDTTVNNNSTNATTGRRPVHWIQSTTRANRNVLSATTTPNFGGSVSDSNRLSDVQLQIAKWDYINTAWTIFNFTTNSWGAYTSNTADAASDACWVSLPAPTQSYYTVDWNYTYTNGASMTVPTDDGYYSIRLRAKDVSTVVGGTAGWATTNHGHPVVSQFVYFFIDKTPPVLTDTTTAITGMGTTVSSRYRTSYQLPFSFSATDANLFESVVISAAHNMEDTVGTLPGSVTVASPRQTGNPATAWAPAASNMAFTPREQIANGSSTTGSSTTGLPDGKYKITFTATDLAGRTTTVTRDITLDNRAPTAKINEPRIANDIPGFAFASDPKVGGEAFTIEGDSSDTGINGSASEPAGIWYRIGYGTQAQTSLPNVAGLTAAQRSRAIAIWAANTGSGLTGVPTTGNGDTGAAYNTNFDTASLRTNTQGSLWFKYDYNKNFDGNDTIYDAPYDFTPKQAPSATPPAIYLYEWLLSATSNVARNYAIGTVTAMRGRNYEKGIDQTNNARALAREIPETSLPLDLQGRGYYSLPLVIRVVDNAGNVFYELRDIWLYPNGDNPTSIINNPSDRFTGRANPRGGQLSIEGRASDNNSVRTVIYRVKVDNVQNTAAGAAPLSNVVMNEPYPAGNGGIVVIPNAKPWASHPRYSLMHDIWEDMAHIYSGATSNNTVDVTDVGWYYADPLSSPFDKTTDWNFMLNASDEIKKLIPTKGFRYPSGAGNFNMIRVWVEAFVFDGKTGNDDDNYNMMSLGDSRDPTIARPYVREFFFTTAAPEIVTPLISPLGSTTPSVTITTPAPPPENLVRGGNFAVRATINSPDAEMKAISVRLRDDTDSAVSVWRDVWNSGTATTRNGVTLSAFTNNGRTATLTYLFDSTRATSNATYQAVRNGGWATSGGTYRIDYRVQDVTNAEFIYPFEVGVDNFVPLADTQRNTTPSKVAGSNVSFLGRVFDYRGSPNSDPTTPTHRKISQVQVWFTNRADTQYISMAGGAGGAVVRTTQGSVARTQVTGIYTSPGATITYDNNNNVTNIVPSGTPATASRYIPTAANYVKLITASAGGTWSPADTREMDISWSFMQDTRVLGDGWITMHYVVTDQANNRSYYTQEMIVMNNYPSINRVTLYTNNTGEGAVFTTHEGDEAYSEYTIPTTPYASGYLNSGFISKNRVIGFGVETISGNPPLRYQARYVERYRVPLSKANLIAMAKLAAGNAADTDILRYYNDATPSVLIENEPVNSFVNLYTIVSGSETGLTPAQWRILGVSPVKDPVAGSHFVFQGVDGGGGSDDVNLLDGNASAFVYAYRHRLATADVDGTSNETRTIQPTSLNFSGATYFGTTADLINEANATNTTNAAPGNTAGTAYFLIKVWDRVDRAGGVTDKDSGEKDRLYDAVVVGMSVYLTDGVNPTIRLYDLNPYTEMEIAPGNNATKPLLNDTLNAAAAPNAVGSAEGSNVRRGGLYNVGNDQGTIRSGYIDPRNSTTALYPRVSDRNTATGNLTWTQVRPDGYYAGDANSPYSTADSSTNGPTRDKVSGKVILRGVAYDNQLINSISITIAPKTPAGNTQPVTRKILEMQDTTENGVTVRKMLPPNPNPNNVQAWAQEQLHWRTGHTVEWAYLWDTEKTFADSGTPTVSPTNGLPQEEVTITVSTTDKNGTGGGLPSGTVALAAETTTTFHNTIPVDIVPYVTGFERDYTRATPLYATKRSRQGWYSFFRDEAGIAVLGYNLGAAAANVSIGITHASNGGTTGATTTATTGRSYATKTDKYGDTVGRHVFTVPAAASSGRINVSVSSTLIHNHNSDHVNKSWNRDYNDSTPGSDLWINRPYAHIWRTEENTTTPATLIGGTNSAALQSPGMALEYASGNNPGRLHGAWAAYKDDDFSYGNNNGDRAILHSGMGEPYMETDISIYQGNVTTVGNNTNPQPNVSVTYQGDGRSSVNFVTGMYNNGSTSSGESTLTRLSDATTGRPTDRWKNTRISKAGQNVAVSTNTANANPGLVHVTAYDSYNTLLFYGQRNGTTTAAMIIDGATATTDGNTAISNASDNTGTGLAASNSAGEYSAVDYDLDGYPVIAYYDQQNDTVRLAFGRNTTPGTGNNQWYRRYLLPSSHPLYRGSGQYISMKIDRRGGIHLAFYNSTYNTVVYAYVSGKAVLTGSTDYPPRDDFDYGTAGRYVCTVDNVIRGGQWTDISVDNRGNPMIVYGDSSRIGNYDGARIAYLVGNKSASSDTNSGAYAQNALQFNERTLKCPITGANITGWEALSMPAAYKVKDDRLNIEVWPPTNRVTGTNAGGTAADPGGNVGANGTNSLNWSAAVGYGSDYFRVGYFFYPTWKEY